MIRPARHTVPVLITLAALLGACGTPPAPARGAASAPSVDQSSAESAARCLIQTLQAERAAIRAKDRQAADAALAQARALTAVEAVEAEMKKHPNYRPWIGDDPAGGMARLWGSLTAYYLDGVDLSALRSVGGEKVATVLAPAKGPLDTTMLSITCVRQADGRWGVLRVEFSERSASQPTSRVAADGGAGAP